MAEVIDILSNQPHITGEATCLICKNEWIAVAPAGTVWLECPDCGLTKGHFKYACQTDDKEEWVCNCGCSLFKIVPRGVYCPLCGTWQEGF